MDLNNQQNGFNHGRSGQKRGRDTDDETDGECLPISKRINSLSLSAPRSTGNGCVWPAGGPHPSGSHHHPRLPAPPPPPERHLSMPLLVGGAPGPPQEPPSSPPPPPRLGPNPDPELCPEQCPEYYHINSYLYRLHVERMQRLHRQL